MNYIILAILLIIGGYDLYLAIRDRTTLSQAYQKLFPTWIDIIFFTAGLIGLCYWKDKMPELDFRLMVVMAGFWGHITFPNKERYKK